VPAASRSSRVEKSIVATSNSRIATGLDSIHRRQPRTPPGRKRRLSESRGVISRTHAVGSPGAQNDARSISQTASMGLSPHAAVPARRALLSRRVCRRAPIAGVADACQYRFGVVISASMTGAAGSRLAGVSERCITSTRSSGHVRRQSSDMLAMLPTRRISERTPLYLRRVVSRSQFNKAVLYPGLAGGRVQHRALAGIRRAARQGKSCGQGVAFLGAPECATTVSVAGDGLLPRSASATNCDAAALGLEAVSRLVRAPDKIGMADRGQATSR